YQVLSGIVLLLMMWLSFGRVTNPLSRLSLLEASFLFFCTLLVIMSGFYFQAILECFVVPRSVIVVGSPSSALFSPAPQAMLPGSVIAYLAVSTFCLDGRFARLALRIF